MKLNFFSNNIKKIAVLILLFSVQAKAQLGKSMFTKDPIINLENFDKQRVYWGYFLGFSSFDFKTDFKNNPAPGQNIEVKGHTGFNVGLAGVLRLHEYFELRFEPGLYYASRTITYSQFTNVRDGEREVKATYIDFPLMLKYSALRTGNVRPYLVGGLSSTLNLSSNAKSKDDNLLQKFRVKQWTQNYTVGFGVDLYFEYFKFSPSIRGVFGLKNELIPDNDPNSPWTGNIESLKTRAFLINFTFH